VFLGPLAKLARFPGAARRSGSAASVIAAADRASRSWNISCSVRASLMSSRRVLGSNSAVFVLSVLLATGAACAHAEYFPHTTIEKSEQNRKIIETVEEYRQRLMQRNVVGLLALASPRYFEDSGTPRSDDDYGFDGLRKVLETQLPRVKSLRYDIEYRNIRVSGDQAEVEVFLDGSFEIAAPEAGDRYRRVNDYHRFLLNKEGDEWKFIAGM
jgi:hypothetical protein